MSLEQSFEKQGNFLFKYRGQFPIFLFLLVLPFIYLSSFESLSDNIVLSYNYIAVILSMIGFLIRFYTIGTTPKNTSGRNTNKQIAETLNTTGIYSLVRHPLYLANYLIWLGISFYSYNLYFVIFMSLLFWLYYERIMFAEEAFLKKKFNNEFLIWSNNVSAFFPRNLSFISSIIKFSTISVLRREYSSFLSAITAFVYIDILRNYFKFLKFHISDGILIISIISLCVVLVLRTLKHYTLLLNEIDRS
jgi:protein-S-isoprenylcysteine O-methyltransferase Ste14